MKTELISFAYQKFGKPLFFKFSPEVAHETISFFGELLGRTPLTRMATSLLFDFRDERLTQTICGIDFINPVGLSAGFDKDGKLLQIMPSVGFGFMEIGSITNDPYVGNPKPWLYRLKKSRALVVYYGLKNEGAKVILKRIKDAYIADDFKYSISIAKTNCKETNTDKAGVDDYFNCFQKVVKSNLGDFYTINISCPNTFGGEPFTTNAKLDKLLKKFRSIKFKKPLFVKMPINLAWKDFDGLLQVCLKYKVDGLVIGNLNKDHNDPNIKDVIPENIKGGISGKVTWDLSNDLISKTYKKYKNKFVIIGVGGVFSAEDAYEKIKRGATLIQLITGMIYEGPQLIGEINKGLVQLMEKDGYANISEAIGKGQEKTNDYSLMSKAKVKI